MYIYMRLKTIRGDEVRAAVDQQIELAIQIFNKPVTLNRHALPGVQHQPHIMICAIEGPESRQNIELNAQQTQSGQQI